MRYLSFFVQTWLGDVLPKCVMRRETDKNVLLERSGKSAFLSVERA